MSKKTITFRNPSKAALARDAAELAARHPQTEAAADRWVYWPEEIMGTRSEAPIKTEEDGKTTTSIVINISSEPDPFEVIRIWFLLPYLTFLFWTLSAAQRNLRSFGH